MKPGYVKIGLTRQNDVGEHVRQLDNISVPTPFECYFELVADTRIELNDAEQSIDAGERRAIEKIRNRREVRTFTRLNIPIGETLTFSKDPTVTCTVPGARKILFQGEDLSPSAAVLRVVHDMGYDWSNVSGMDYWEWNGVKLSQIGSQAPDNPDDSE